MTPRRRLVRWVLWLAVGVLLLMRSGTGIAFRDGGQFIAPSVFSGAALVWFFVTGTILWRRVRGRKT